MTGKDLNAFVSAASAATTIVEPSTVLSGVGAFATLAPTTTATGPASGATNGSSTGASGASPTTTAGGNNGAGALQASGVFAFLAAALGVAVL